LLLKEVNMCWKYITNLKLSFPSLPSSFPAKSVHSDCHSACQQCSWYYREWRYLLFFFHSISLCKELSF
jgi:hypothetical protein